MFSLSTISIRYAALVLFGLTVVGGDALHWIPGAVCCHRSQSCEPSHSPAHSCRHQHNHRAVASSDIPSVAPVQVDAPDDCPICRLLGIAAAPICAALEIASLPLVTAIVLFPPPRESGDVILAASPRGPPTFA